MPAHTLTLEEVDAGVTLSLDAEDPEAPSLVVEPGMPCSLKAVRISGSGLTYRPGAPQGGEPTNDLYAILSQGTIKVTKSSDTKLIKRAHRQLMLVHHTDKGGDPQVASAINEAYAVLSDPDSKDAYDNPAPQIVPPEEWAIRISLESVAERKARGKEALHRVDWSQCQGNGLSVADAVEMLEKLGRAGIISRADDTCKDIHHKHAKGADLLLVKHITAEQALQGVDGELAKVDLPSGECCRLSPLAEDQNVLEDGYVEIIEGRGLPKHRDATGARGRLIVQYRVSSPEPAFAAGIIRDRLATKKLREVERTRIRLSRELQNNAREVEEHTNRLNAEIQDQRHAWREASEEQQQRMQQLASKNASQAELLQQLQTRITELELAETQAKEQTRELQRELQAAKASNKGGFFQSLSNALGGTKEETTNANETCTSSTMLGTYEVIADRVPVYEDAQCTQAFYDESQRTPGGRTTRQKRQFTRKHQFDADRVACFTAADGTGSVTLHCMVDFQDGSRGAYGWVKHNQISLRMTAPSGISPEELNHPRLVSGTDTTAHIALVQELQGKTLELAAKDRELEAKNALLTELNSQLAQTQSKLESAAQERRDDTEWGRGILQIAMDSGLCPPDFLQELPVDHDAATFDVRPVRDRLLTVLQACIEQQAVAVTEAKTNLESLSNEVHQRAANLLSTLAARRQHAVSTFPDSCSGLSTDAALEHLDHAVAVTRAELEQNEKDEEALRSDLARQKKQVNDAMDGWKRAVRASSDVLSNAEVRDDGSCSERDNGVLQTVKALQKLHASCADSVNELEELGSMFCELDSAGVSPCEPETKPDHDGLTGDRPCLPKPALSKAEANEDDSASLPEGVPREMLASTASSEPSTSVFPATRPVRHRLDIFAGVGSLAKLG